MSTTTDTISTRHQLVLDVISAAPGGATDHDIAAALKINLRTANMQRLWLLRHGVIQFAGCQDTGAAVQRTAWRCTDV